MDVLIFEEAPKVYASDAQARALVVPGGSAFNTARHAARWDLMWESWLCGH